MSDCQRAEAVLDNSGGDTIGKMLEHYFFRNLNKTYPLVREGHGVWLTDSEGRKYLDGSSGAICANIGHGVPEVIEAITEQLHKIAFVHSSQFVTEPGAELCRRLIEKAPDNFRPGGRVYLTSGGSESVETAIKMARSYWVEKGETSRTHVISRVSSYHGSTLGALSLTGHLARRIPYEPWLRDKRHIRPSYPYRCECSQGEGQCDSKDCGIECANDLETAILDIGPENVVGFVAEPVVGAALGAVVPHESYWPRIEQICRQYGILMIADEVMTGLGRTGRDFACQHWDLSPDIIILGKGLSAGYMPLGGVLASSEVVSAFESGSGIFEHGFTYSGHPGATAAGCAVLAYIDDNKLVEAVSMRESYLKESLEELYKWDIVGDVRGCGFMFGVEFVACKASKKPFPREARLGELLTGKAKDLGLIVYPGAGSAGDGTGDHIIVAPPFTVSDDEMEEMFLRLNRAIESISNRVASRT